jgi:branched-chain amino acid transport system substrate-binding protein
MKSRVSKVVRATLLAATIALSLTAHAQSGDGGKAAAKGSPIPVASILDETGAISGYGLPMQEATILAIANINANGGVLGRPLQLTALDSQSSQPKYVVLARQVASSDAAVVIGGILSASREAIRPIFHSAKKLYFYAPLYEGGVCDKNMVGTGPVPTQQLAPLLKWAVDNGLKKWYIMAANYNFGQISASWAKEYAKTYGASVVGDTPEFYALDKSDFASEIPKIQSSGADLVVSFLVGSAQENFYKQWTATGLNKTTKIVSTTYGYGAEQITLGQAGAGIYAVWPFMPTAATGSISTNAFVQAWKKSGTKQPITPGAASTWNAWHLWADAANKAGSVNRDKVIAAIESGSVSFDGPGGRITIDGPTHQAVLPMRLYQDNGNGSFDQVKPLSEAAPPTFLQEKCSLIKSPTVSTQFTPAVGK